MIVTSPIEVSPPIQLGTQMIPSKTTSSLPIPIPILNPINQVIPPNSFFALKRTKVHILSEQKSIPTPAPHFKRPPSSQQKEKSKKVVEIDYFNKRMVEIARIFDAIYDSGQSPPTDLNEIFRIGSRIDYLYFSLIHCYQTSKHLEKNYQKIFHFSPNPQECQAIFRKLKQLFSSFADNLKLEFDTFFNKDINKNNSLLLNKNNLNAKIINLQQVCKYYNNSLLSDPVHILNHISINLKEKLQKMPSQEDLQSHSDEYDSTLFHLEL